MYIGDLNCTGDERSTQNCSYTSPRSGSCSNAAIICQREFDFNGTYKHFSDACIKHCLYFAGTNDGVDVTCTDGSVRLVGGINELEGSLEICYNRFWVSVCDSS